jgi:hypothetical protein
MDDSKVIRRIVYYLVGFFWTIVAIVMATKYIWNYNPEWDDRNDI